MKSLCKNCWNNTVQFPYVLCCKEPYDLYKLAPNDKRVIDTHHYKCNKYEYYSDDTIFIIFQYKDKSIEKRQWFKKTKTLSGNFISFSSKPIKAKIIGKQVLSIKEKNDLKQFLHKTLQPSETHMFFSPKILKDI
jgi:hypothetical protein